MDESPETEKTQKAKYDYLGGQGCLVVFAVGAVCFASSTIMTKAYESLNGVLGAIAVVALSAMGVGVSYFLLKGTNR